MKRRDFLKLAIGAAIAITEPTERVEHAEIRSPSRETAKLGEAMMIGYRRGSDNKFDENRNAFMNSIVAAYDEILTS